VGNKKLFDDEVEHYGGPATDTESSFHFLNRAQDSSWQKVREVLDEWYSHHPDPGGDLRSRFQQHDNRQHTSAWWELYTHALFRRLGFDVTVHPDLPEGTGRPDLLVSDGESQLYVECVALFENRPARGNADARAWIFECINGTPNPDFMVDVDIESSGTRRPRKAEITNRITEWLDSLDYEAALALQARGAAHNRIFAFGDWEVRLTANPVLPKHRGKPSRLIGRYPFSGVYTVTSVTDIRKLLEDKASQCRGADAPLVIAVHNCSTFAKDDDIEKAAFGSLTYNYYEGVRDSGWWSRAPDGYWHPGPPPRGATLSAVMFNERLTPYNVAEALPNLWINPWAEKRVGTRLPFRAYSAFDSGEAYLAAEGTASAANVFGLPEGWPGFTRR
jgi:hypothetical protein